MKKNTDKVEIFSLFITEVLLLTAILVAIYAKSASLPAFICVCLTAMVQAYRIAYDAYAKYKHKNDLFEEK